MSKFHHQKLPSFQKNRDQFKNPNILCGHSPPDQLGYKSDDLQIIYNFQDWSWVEKSGERLHYHTESDECFVVLQGRLIVQVDQTEHEIAAREYCLFPKGVVHAILKVETPIEFLVIRAPSVADKVYLE